MNLKAKGFTEFTSLTLPLHKYRCENFLFYFILQRKNESKIEKCIFLTIYFILWIIIGIRLKMYELSSRENVNHQPPFLIVDSIPNLWYPLYPGPLYPSQPGLELVKFSGSYMYFSV